MASMKITIDENGNITPEGAAELLAAIGEWERLREGVGISDTVSGRTFQCTHCGKTFTAPAGKETTHDCEPPVA